jgi:hypothetical protein
MEEFMRALEGSDRFFADTSLKMTVLALLLAFVLGQLIAWVYSRSHSGLSYSKSFTQSLVLMTVVVSMVMFVIGNSIITAFGLLGALALIRFRNVLKDTRDTVFVFIALVVGMAVGAQRFGTAIVGTAALLLVVAYLNLTGFGSLHRFDGYLTCRLARSSGGDGPGPLPEIGRLIGRFCRAVKLISKREAGEAEQAEYVYQIGLRDRERTGELLGELRQVEGVEHASLVLRSELSEV